MVRWLHAAVQLAVQAGWWWAAGLLMLVSAGGWCVGRRREWPANHPTSNAMAPKVDLGPEPVQRDRVDSAALRRMCSLEKMFQEPCSSGQQWLWRLFTWPLSNMHLASCTLGPSSNRLEAVRQSPAITGPSAESASMATSWDVAAKTGECKHLTVRSFES